MPNMITGPHPGGSVSKFNEDRAERLLLAARGGNTLKTSAAYAGITYTTLRRWILMADDPDAPPHFAEFKRDLEKARADAEVEALAHIRLAGKSGQWQADAWFLERSFPEDWGRRDTNRVELVGEGGGPVRVVAGIGLDNASMAALAQRLASRMGDEDIIDAEIVEEPQKPQEAPGELEATEPIRDAEKVPEGTLEANQGAWWVEEEPPDPEAPEGALEANQDPTGEDPENEEPEPQDDPLGDPMEGPGE